MITVVAISSEKDFEVANEWLAHLPHFVKKLIVKTVQKGETRIVSDRNDIAIHEWGYEVFRFDEARNHALSLVETDWCIMLDIDERLQIFKSDVDFIESQPEDVAGLKVTLACFMPTADTRNGGVYECTRVLRKDVRYKYRCHEDPKPWIFENGYKISQSPLLIRHDGYIDPVEFKGKLVRNYHLILDDMMEDRENRTDSKLVGDLFRTIEGFKSVANN